MGDPIDFLDLKLKREGYSEDEIEYLKRKAKEFNSLKMAKSALKLMENVKGYFREPEKEE